MWLAKIFNNIAVKENTKLKNAKHYKATIEWAVKKQLKINKQ